MSTPPVPDDGLVEFYTSNYDESARLTRPRSRLEFLRTQELLRQRLPAAPARVLGDARSLDDGNASVDACLLLGPLYHLPGPGCGAG